jgi:hypothetical protein
MLLQPPLSQGWNAPFDAARLIFTDATNGTAPNGTRWTPYSLQRQATTTVLGNTSLAINTELRMGFEAGMVMLIVSAFHRRPACCYRYHRSRTMPGQYHNGRRGVRPKGDVPRGGRLCAAREVLSPCGRVSILALPDKLVPMLLELVSPNAQCQLHRARLCIPLGPQCDAARRGCCLASSQCMGHAASPHCRWHALAWAA